MAIAYRASATAGGSSAANLTITKPTGTAADDILIMNLYTEGGPPPTMTPPTGWTELTGAGTTNTVSTPDMRQQVYWLRAGGSEPADYTWTFAESWRAGQISAYSGGITTGDPTDPESVNAAAAADTAPIATAITTTVADTMVLYLHDCFDTRTVTPPTGMTERVEFTLVYLAEVAQAVAGTTGTKTSTLSADSVWIAALTALLPAVAATVTPPRPVIVRQAVKRANSW